MGEFMYCEVICTCVSRTGKKRKTNQDNVVIDKVCRNADDRENFDCSYDSMKIAEITQIKEGTVKSHLSRGKEKLANYLKQNGYG